MPYETIEITVDADLLEGAKAALSSGHGMAVEEAVALFLEKCVDAGGIPFDFDPEQAKPDHTLGGRMRGRRGGKPEEVDWGAPAGKEMW